MPAINLGMPHHKGDNWRASAACAEVGGELFFSDIWHDQVRAKTICDTVCTVREACLTEALDNNEQFAVWGGTSVRERARLRKQTA